MGDINTATVAHCGNGATRPKNQNMEHAGRTLLALGWVFNLIALVDKANISFTLSSTCSVLAIIYYLLRLREEIKKK